MKANQFGTATEQQLFHLGYLTLKQRPSCGNCKHVRSITLMPDTDYESERYRCVNGGFATTKTAICDKWEAK